MRLANHVVLAFTLWVGCSTPRSKPDTDVSSASVIAPLGAQQTAATSTRDSYVVRQPLTDFANLQEQIFQTYENAPDLGVKETAAYVLSELWKEHLLKKAIKDLLAERHYKIVLLQIHGDSPNLVVRCHQNFPFPDVWVAFSPTLYRNGRVEWEGISQREHVLSLNNSTLTSRTGGVMNNGDVLYYEIKIQERVADKEVIWEKVIKTNELVLQGLKR